MNLKLFVSSFLTLLCTLLHAQQKYTLPSSGKETLLCRSWKFIGSEEFGLENEPTAEQKNDSISLYQDKKIILVKNGKVIKGSWSVDKAGNFLYLAADTAKTKIMFGLKNISKDKLVIEHQTPDLVRTRYHYEPVR